MDGLLLRSESPTVGRITPEPELVEKKQKSLETEIKTLSRLVQLFIL